MALSCLAGVQALAQDSLDAFGSVPAERPVVAWPSGQVTATERRLGVPTFFWASPHHASRTPRAVGLSATEAARQHLLAHVALYRGSPPQWAAAEVAHVHDTGQGAVIVAFQQRVDGVRIFRDELKVVMDRELNLVALSGYLTPELKALGAFALTATSAVATAWQLETRQLAEPREPSRSVPDDGGYLRWEEPGRFARARPVWFALGDGLVPAYSIELESSAGSHAWVISAADGRPLFRKNLTASHSYFVWADPATKLPHPSPEGPAALPHPTGWVDGTIHGRVSQQLITLDHAGLSTGDPWLPPGAATLTGNNVRAYADLYYPDGYSPSRDLAGQASAPGVFQYTYDHARDASADDTQRQASLVHLFYVNNFLHDWLYDAGFDERAGNAQLDNFQRGGQERDELLAEGLDWSGCCNANMMTPADGRSPRMQMYRWLDQIPSRDSGLDTTIVAHEFGHLVSDRLIGNGTGIANHQGDALGEGWSDFLACLLLATADDTQVVNNATWGGAFPLGGYADGSPNSSTLGFAGTPSPSTSRRTR
ncbi:MAG: M36 family metallopeptidase [Myxococcales bacterium]|nr:M36 family metallopeptidase [Myxococcales bacterium]